MNLSDPEYRDSVRDVLAMLEAAAQIQGDLPDCGLARENLTVLTGNADTVTCLQVAVSMLASTFQVVCAAREQARGTSPEQEMAEIVAEFRKQLS